VQLIEEFFEDSLVEAVKKAMPLLDGMYAFAATDGKSLVLARDPIGKKPLYFTNQFPFYFASERKALINDNANIKRLTPGWIAEVSKEDIRFEKVCEIERPPIEINTMNEALSAYEKAFDRSIEKRIDGLDKVGVLFSGGIDSVLVSRALQLKGCDVTCYSVGTEDCSDLRMALKAAEKLGLEIKVEYLTEKLIEKILCEVIEAIELNGLLQVEVAIPMYIAAKVCREDDHKVMFTGQAADELFAGYSWYKDVIKEDGLLALHDRLWDDIDKLYLDTLEREDRMAMAHSIELRAPFLDRELIRTAMRISPHLKIEDSNDPYRKRVHRELALKKGIPRELSYREKSPAQDGTGIHGLIEEIAEKHFDGTTFEEAELLDYGSNYRYLGNEYGTPAMLAFLDEITSKNNINSIATNNENI
ncbi:MAG: asparagine synthetase B family protein, partial [Thermodesulfobacteriota bacterium]